MLENYTRVTDVLYPLTGLKFINPEVLQNAAIRGTKVHEYCDAIISGMGLFGMEEEVKGYVDSFSQWMPKKFIKKPPRFYCDELMITGECDGIYQEENGDLVLVDFKTSASQGKTWKYQGSAYSYMAKKAGFDIKKIQFVKLSKEGKKPVVYEYEEDMQGFRNCLFVYREFFKPMDGENPMEYI